MKKNKLTISILGFSNVIIFLAFFFAKIFDKIDWSWWWVFSPFWIPLGIIFLLCLIVFILYFIYIVLSKDLWK